MMHSCFRRAIATAILTSCAFLVMSPGVQAQPSGGSPTTTDMDKLKDQGYTCGRAGIGGYLCKKTGSPDKVCDNAGTCTTFRIVLPKPKPVAPNPGVPAPVAPIVVGP